MTSRYPWQWTAIHTVVTSIPANSSTGKQLNLPAHSNTLTDASALLQRVATDENTYISSTPKHKFIFNYLPYESHTTTLWAKLIALSHALLLAWREQVYRNRLLSFPSLVQVTRNVILITATYRVVLVISDWVRPGPRQFIDCQLLNAGFSTPTVEI